MPPLEWRSKTREIVRKAVQLVEIGQPQRIRAPTSLPGPLKFDVLGARGRWAEVTLEAPRLRLIGRADVVEKKDQAVTIRDLKTGRAEAPDGSILNHIQLQLRLYGLMVKEYTPDTDVCLIIDADVEREVSFNEEEAEQTRTWVVTTLDALPAGQVIPATEIAAIGEWCGNCPHRHICGRYREAAPELWSVGSAFRLPIDIWGRVEAIAPSKGTYEIAVRDSGGRKVKITGLQQERLEGVNVGDPIALFGLGYIRRDLGSGTWRHPLNFFEEDVANPHARAWTLEVFV